jgi:hypothetical protein
VNDWNPVARLLIFGGIALIVLGLIVQFAGRFFPMLGHLPGDIVIQRDNFTLYIPITTMILVSVVLTLVFALVSRLLNR